MRFWTLIIFLFPAWSLFGQEPTYVFDVKDSTTYDITCGKITGSYWGNINDTCMLTTTPLILGSSCGDTNFVNVPVVVRINPSGNMECDDLAITQFYCEMGGWQTLDTIQGCTVTNNQTYYYNAPCANKDTFMVRVRFSNNDTTEKWQIRDGDIEIYDECGLLPLEVRTFNLTEDGSDLTFKLLVNEPIKKPPVLQYSDDAEIFWNMKWPTDEAEEEKGYAYYWKVTDGLKEGYYRANMSGDDGAEQHTAVIRYEQDRSTLVSMKLTDKRELQVEGLAGMARVLITTMSGNKVEEYEVNDDTGDGIIELPDQLHGIYIATLYSERDHQSIKFVLH